MSERKSLAQNKKLTSLSTYDFSTLYTTLPYNLIKEKIINFIEWTFKREGSPYIVCKERQAFFTSADTKRYTNKLLYKLYKQIVGIPMGTNCAPLIADLFLFCYKRDFMTSLSDVKQAEIIEAFKSTSRYLDDLLNIDSLYFKDMANRIYPPELQLNKANTSDTEAASCLDLHLSISYRTSVLNDNNRFCKFYECLGTAMSRVHQSLLENALSRTRTHMSCCVSG